MDFHDEGATAVRILGSDAVEHAAEDPARPPVPPATAGSEIIKKGLDASLKARSTRSALL